MPNAVKTPKPQSPQGGIVWHTHGGIRMVARVIRAYGIRHPMGLLCYFCGFHPSPEYNREHAKQMARVLKRPRMKKRGRPGNQYTARWGKDGV